jgi:hypothetical protein
MQFLGQIHASPEQLLLLFICQNKPGLCDEWDPNSGGNKVVPVIPQNLQLISPPDDGETLRATRYGAVWLQSDKQDYEEARVQWASENGKTAREVLGQMGGEPSWLQNEETPICNFCGNPMQFVAQLDEGPDWKTAMNFGGGGAHISSVALVVKTQPSCYGSAKHAYPPVKRDRLPAFCLQPAPYLQR